MHVYSGDSGFSIDFSSAVDLTAMTNVRMLIMRPDGSTTTYDFSNPEFGGVINGGTLSYMVRDGDLTVSGDYFFQVVAKDAVSDVAFAPWELHVKPRILVDVWG